jgi:hypothetical protein
MKVTELIWSALVLTFLHRKVYGQDECGSWAEPSYSVSESDGSVTLMAKLSEPASQEVFLRWTTRDDSAIGKIQKNCSVFWKMYMYITPLFFIQLRVTILEAVAFCYTLLMILSKIFHFLSTTICFQSKLNHSLLT